MVFAVNMRRSEILSKEIKIGGNMNHMVRIQVAWKIVSSLDLPTPKKGKDHD